MSLGNGNAVEKDSDDEWALDLAAMGYPGFGHLLWSTSRTPRDPTDFLTSVLDQPEVDPRVVNGFPWVLFHFALEMDWEALVNYAVLHNRQNRLGFLVTLAGEFAEKKGDPARANKLHRCREWLDLVRLDQEDTFFDESVSMFSSRVGRQWLELYQPPVARYWKLDTNTELTHIEKHME